MDTLKDRESEQISVRLPARLRKRLERIAEQEDRTLSGTIRRIVVRALNQDERIAA